jgi:hypothetical protein
MLSPSPSKITDLAIPGASLRPADLAAPQNCETRGAGWVGFAGIALCSATPCGDLAAAGLSRSGGAEQAFADGRQIIGVGEARNRTRRAAERTGPFGLICFSMVTVWYALHGHAPEDVTGHRARARWYTTKEEPSYDDMTIKLRRVIIAARFRSPCPEQATPQETRAVLAAWAAAGT